jgi:hypothetical protein
MHAAVALLEPLPQIAMVPDSAPPYDCALHGTACQEQTTVGGPAPLPVPDRPAVPAVVTSKDCAGTLWPRQFAQAIVETLAGLRPRRQLAGWSTEHVQERIQSIAPTLRTDHRPKVIRVLASQPATDVAEVTVVAMFGARARALAMRFEHQAARTAVPGRPSRPARWLCTAIEVG